MVDYCRIHGNKPTIKCPLCRSFATAGRGSASILNNTGTAVPSNAPVVLNPDKTTRISLSVLRAPCRYEEQIIERCTKCGAAGELNHVRSCELFDSCTRGPNKGNMASCSSCKSYLPPTFVAEKVTTPEGAGVVLGCYGMPNLARLQIKTIRQTCGEVPILIADDGSEKDDEFEKLCTEFTNVEFWPSDTRLGHYAGDLSVYWKGLQWAHTRGLKWLCKLSQRFIWTRQNWLAESVKVLSDSGKAILMQRCHENGNNPKTRVVDLKIRSESIIMDVAAWLPFYREMTKSRLNNATEYFLWGIIHREWQEQFCPWSEMTVNRYAITPGTIWHGSHAKKEYEALALRLGVQLDKEFTVAGWNNLPGWKRG